LPRRIRESDDSIQVDLELARVYRHSTAECFFANDPLGLFCDSVSAIERARRAPPSVVLAGAYAELGGLFVIAGLRRLGRGVLRRAVRVAELAEQPAALAYTHMVNGLFAVGVGDWDTAKQGADECQAMCERLGDRVTWTNAQAFRFWTHFYRGQLESGISVAEEMLERARAASHQQHEAWALRFLGLCALRQAEFERAKENLEQSLERLGETHAVNDLIPNRGYLALVNLKLKEDAQARKIAEETLGLMMRIKRPILHSVLEGASAVTEVMFDALRRDPDSPMWRREARRCLEWLKRYRRVFPIGEPRYQYWRGHYHALSDRNVAATTNWRLGRRTALKLGMNWDAAMLTAELGRQKD
jgi:tetratricopeptide (TPR) repeat protein